MSIGYACLTLGVPDTAIKKCMMKNADDVRLHTLIGENLSALERMVDYNIKNSIRLFRISSDIIPFASSPVNTIPWMQIYQDRLAGIGQKVRQSGMRVSMHPGQYTVLNSPNDATVSGAVAELTYHTRFLDSLQVDDTNKIILHVGGAYGDKAAAMSRFCKKYDELDSRIKARLVIENDDSIYNVEEVLTLGVKCRIPVVFDNLHNQTNPAPAVMDEPQWIRECKQTWMEKDGRQKIHYSQQDAGKKPGAHSGSISIDAFMRFYQSLGEEKPDIMLEVKDKNISAIKCVLCTLEKGEISALEREWARYKYLVLEHSQQAYQSIRRLIRNKSAYPAIEFYRVVEEALKQPVHSGSALNAAAHVWGYFKETANAREKAGVAKSMAAYEAGKGQLALLKRRLYALAKTYGQQYLLESYYFHDMTE